MKHYVLTNTTAAVFNSPPPPVPPPPPHPIIIPPTPPSRRDRTWAWVRRHPWLSALIGIWLGSNVFTLIWRLLEDHRALRVHAFVIFLFWVLAIGTLPIVAMVRTADNAIDKVFGDDVFGDD